ncbi:branched-chain amino acid ABC transporter permease [Pinisolibacter sp.]|uniref:branched-chain amino acid ABC transporter permease n=1 Tax=Pinisolibacter sp. TaxID=2172024 RepID=UPI002FDCBC5B
MAESDPHRPALVERLAPLVVVALLAAVPPVAQMLGDPFLIKVATRVVVFAIAAVALNLILGFAGLVSLLQAGLFGVGGYAVAIAAHHVFEAEPIGFSALAWEGSTDLALTLPLAAAVAGLVALVTGMVSLRTSGPYFLMITLAFDQMLYYGAVALQKYGGDDGLQILTPLSFAGWDMSNRWRFFYFALTMLAVVLLVATRLVASRFGIVLRASAENERRVAVSGIPPYAHRLAAFTVSGAVAGLAGGLLAAGQQFVSPADMHWVRSGDFVVMAVLGGLSTVWGPVVGAAAFVVLELLLSSWTQHWQLAFGLIIVAVVLTLRGGLSDLVHLAGRSRGAR